MKPVASDAAGLQDRVARTGDHEYLTQRRPGFDIVRLLKEIGFHSASCLPEELGDIQDAEGLGTQTRGESAVGDIARNR
jgi:hypothetical protein